MTSDEIRVEEWHTHTHTPPPLPRWHGWFLWSRSSFYPLMKITLLSVVFFLLFKNKRNKLKICNNIFRCKVACEPARNWSVGKQEMEERGVQEVRLMWECLKNWLHETFIVTWLHSELLMFCLCAQVAPMLKINVYNWYKKAEKKAQTIKCPDAVN